MPLEAWGAWWPTAGSGGSVGGLWMVAVSTDAYRQPQWHWQWGQTERSGDHVQAASVMLLVKVGWAGSPTGSHTDVSGKGRLSGYCSQVAMVILAVRVGQAGTAGRQPQQCWQWREGATSDYPEAVIETVVATNFRVTMRCLCLQHLKNGYYALN